MSVRTLVVGGGITGLALGHRLLEGGPPGREVLVLEARPRAGGHAVTLHAGGFLVETGPNAFLSREPATLELARALGLEPIEARPAAKRRFIVRGGRLCRVPESPPALLTSAALSPAGKLRLLLEPFARPAPAGVEETVHEFAVRRIGAEAADMLVDAAVAGISAGDSRALAVEAAFPLMIEMEREHGSLIRAMVARARAGRISRLLSFPGGLGDLTGALAARLGPALRTGARVLRLARGRGRARWSVTLAGGEVLDADRVVLATPAWASAELVAGLDPGLAARLREFPFADVSLVALAYPLRDVPRALDGYGYLVTRGERMSTLGVVWESSLFEGRAPEGFALLRAFVGGARDPRAAGLPEADVLALVRRELHQVLGVGAEPREAWVFRWPRSIAQYTRGHLARVREARERAAALGGLELTGTSYDGVSFNHAVVAAATLARRLNDADAGNGRVHGAAPAGGASRAPDPARSGTR